MSAKKRTAKFVAPKDEAKDASSDEHSTSGSDDDDFAFYQQRFPLPTNAPKSARRPAASSQQSNQQQQQQQQRQSEEWVEVHDTRKDKYQQRRSAKEAELAALQAEAEDNKRNEFSSLPRFVPYVRDAAGKWLGGTKVHKAKPKQLGVIEEYIIPEPSGKQHKKKKQNDLLLTANNSNSSSSGGSGGGGGGSKEWSSEADMAATIANWIEHQLGAEEMTVAQIGERIQARVGESWNKRYKPRHGPLVEWLKTRAELEVHADRVTVRQQQQQHDTRHTSPAHRQQQQREQRERDAQRSPKSATRVVDRAQRSWLAFLLYAVALAVVGFGAYSVWSGHNMSDLARQLSQQLEAMEAQVADVKQAATAEHSGRT